MLLKIFKPSVRKTLFFQKKIKQLNVEFIEIIVIPQYAAKSGPSGLPEVNTLSLEFIFIGTITNTGMDSVT